MVHDIKNRLNKKGLVSSIMSSFVNSEGVEELIREPRVTLIAKPITTVNKQLERGHYFFRDIKKEGVLLYDDGEFVLSDARELAWEERREIAKEDFEYWFGRGESFFIDTHNALERDDFSKSAFELHQATESFYAAILLTFSGDRPKLHDIAELGSMARIHNEELITIFPMLSSKHKEAFELLKAAYINARYNKSYNITKEQLLYLIERVEKLKLLSEKMCLGYINQKNK